MAQPAHDKGGGCIAAHLPACCALQHWLQLTSKDVPCAAAHITLALYVCCVLGAGGSRSGAVDIIRVSGSEAVQIVRRVFWPQASSARQQAGAGADLPQRAEAPDP